MMGSLGLMEGVGWGDDVENVIGEEDDEMNGGDSNDSPNPNGTPKAPEPKDIFEGLSARQVTMLKRKKGNIVEEANKYVCRVWCPQLSLTMQITAPKSTSDRFGTIDRSSNARIFTATQSRPSATDNQRGYH